MKMIIRFMNPQQRNAPRAFTLVELLVVIGVVGILAALLLPALSRAKSKAKVMVCTSNTRQFALAFLMYANDNSGDLPPLNDGSYTTMKTHDWWMQIISQGGYITPVAITHNVWRCPVVKDGDIPPTATFFKCPVEGYGPFVGRGYGTGPNGDRTTGIIRFSWNVDGTRLGSRKLTEIRRPSQIMCVGDAGVPKANRFWEYGNAYRAKDEFPGNDYWTDAQIYTPLPDSGWREYGPAGPVPIGRAGADKQPACRHNERAVFSLFDGHVEVWPWSDLRHDKLDVFAIHSF
jgi:prepilin-type N-terminal cleavage/methylation domain-containing protein/prepilin-type processing-associated H-X9-DG protein